MNGFAIAGLIYLYVIVYGLGLWSMLKKRDEPTTVITRNMLISSLVLQLLELLSILAIWFDRDPMSLPRAFVGCLMIAEVLFESFRGYLHYKKAIPLRRNLAKAVIQSGIMVVLIAMLAFVL